MKTLKELLIGIDILSSKGNLDIEVTGLHLNSRRMKPGNCFVAIRGFKENGLKYLNDAIANGATSVVFETRPEETLPDIPESVVWVLVKSARPVLSHMASIFYNRVQDEIYITGVTGTNGKTTIVSLLYDIYNLQDQSAKIGTLGMECGPIKADTKLTTPEAPDIFDFLAQARKTGCQNLVMEVSSVALKLQRVRDLHFGQAIFTGLSGDHLDFHGTMEEYLDSKLILFRQLAMDDWAVVNIDDFSAPRVLENLDSKYLTYGFSEEADVRPKKYKCTMGGIQATLRTPKGEIDIKSTLLGRVNLSNIMAAVTSAIIKGISFDNISRAVAGFKPAKGRMDIIYRKRFAVMIDYAHTDNAMEQMLKSLRDIVPQRIILVFGAGGSRDTGKRPRMGEVAQKNADVVVVTSDNPRREDPGAIISDVVSGFDEGFKDYLVQPDREKAIEEAILMADSGDLVVIAGKGHEDYQIFKDRTIRFDDYEKAQNILDKIILDELKEEKEADA